MIDSYNESFDKGIFSASQKQAVITLLQKNGKDRLFLQNWRPISLLNVDYKILTKVISKRIKNVLPSIIHENQSGFVPRRKTEQAINIIQDIMNYTEHKKLSGFLLFIDFEKAFDSIEWDFMTKCLEKFNFGKDILTWVSCVINNGTTCQYFKIGRGVRQGDPLSPYLFIICVEMLAIAVRSNKIIKGIHMGEEFKLTQFADDLTCSLSDIQSGKELFKLINKFEICSGLKLNISKTEALWIGKDKNKTEKPFNIKWSTKPINLFYLWFYVAFNTAQVISRRVVGRAEETSTYSSLGFCTVNC